MKTNSIIRTLLFMIFLAAIAVASVRASAATSSSDASRDLEELGGNRDVRRRAEQVDARSRVSIVQNRSVNRDWRLEIGANYAPVASGDAYLFTQNIGGQVDLHITPKFSIGARYAKAFNTLTSEGRAQYDAARTAKNNGSSYPTIPAVDYPEESILGVVNWYMLYGKLNFFDLRVVQFDLYSLAGAGQVTLSGGPVSTWTAGGGIGFWLSQHITSRIELRYQTYDDHVEAGGRPLNLAIMNFGLGVLL
jgi:outer membrane beta-barrel protein